MLRIVPFNRSIEHVDMAGIKCQAFLEVGVAGQNSQAFENIVCSADLNTVCTGIHVVEKQDAAGRRLCLETADLVIRVVKGRQVNGNSRQ